MNKNLTTSYKTKHRMKFLVASVVSIIFVLGKFIDMRFIEKENKPLKYILRDCIYVFLSVYVGLALLEQFMPNILPQNGGGVTAFTPPSVFMDEPDF